jgi:NADH-quinone oxidoreductase subunit J
MNIHIILFMIIGVFTLGSALMVVTTSNLVYMALWLISTLLGVAIIFVSLSASFLGVTQVIIYIGAIAILVIFAIMLTRRVTSDDGPRYNNNWRWALFLAIISFAGILFILTNWSGINNPMPDIEERTNYVVELGKALLDPNGFLLAFELASILLLAALIGAIYIAWDRRKI